MAKTREFSFPHANGSEPSVINFTTSIDESLGESMPWKSYSLDEMKAIWAEQGIALEAALRATISGALYDALFAAMARRSASLLVIPHRST